MPLSTDQFIGLLNGGRESRAVEFKPAGPRTDPLGFAFVARAVLALSNLQLGGWVLLGVRDNGEVVGLSETDLGSWLERDAVTAGLNAYADPFIQVEVEPLEYETKRLLVLRVQEFAEVPVLARKDSVAKADGKLVIRQGGCYVRTRLKPASVEVPTQTEMRELLDLAADKLLKRFVARAAVAGVSVATAETDRDKFDKELGTFR